MKTKFCEMNGEGKALTRREKLKEFGKHFLDRMKKGLGKATILGVGIVGAGMIFSSCQDDRTLRTEYYCKLVPAQEDVVSSDSYEKDVAETNSVETQSVYDSAPCKHPKQISECNTTVTKLLEMGNNVELDYYRFLLEDLEILDEGVSALYGIYDGCGAAITKVKVKSGQSEEVVLDGVTYSIEATETAAGYTYGARWAKTTISVVCQGEDLVEEVHEDVIEGELIQETEVGEIQPAQSCIPHDAICHYSLDGIPKPVILDDFEGYEYTQIEELSSEITENDKIVTYTIKFEDAKGTMGIPVCPKSGGNECSVLEKSSNHKIKIQFAGETLELLAMIAPSEPGTEITNEVSTAQGGFVMLSKIASNAILNLGEGIPFAGYLFKFMGVGTDGIAANIGIYTNDADQLLKLVAPTVGTAYQYAIVDDKQFELYVHEIANGPTPDLKWADLSVLNKSLLFVHGANLYDFPYGGQIITNNYCAPVTLKWKNKNGSQTDTQADNLIEIKVVAKCDQ